MQYWVPHLVRSWEQQSVWHWVLYLELQLGRNLEQYLGPCWAEQLVQYLVPHWVRSWEHQSVLHWELYLE